MFNDIEDIWVYLRRNYIGFVNKNIDRVIFYDFIENNLIFELVAKGAFFDKQGYWLYITLGKFVCTFSIFSPHKEVYCDTNMGDKEDEITTEVQNTKDNQVDLKLVISDIKKGKRKAKSLLTRLLTQLVGLLAIPEGIEHNRSQLYELLQRIDEQQQVVLDIMDELETAFRKMDDNVNATKTTDEAEKIEQQVEGEIVVARAAFSITCEETGGTVSIVD